MEIEKLTEYKLSKGDMVVIHMPPQFSYDDIRRMKGEMAGKLSKFKSTVLLLPYDMDIQFLRFDTLRDMYENAKRLKSAKVIDFTFKKE